MTASGRAENGADDRAAELIGAYWQGAHMQDPLFLERMRAVNPVLLSPPHGLAVLTGHAEIAAALRHPDVRTTKFEGGEGFSHTASYAVMNPMMLFHDGGSHTRLRSLAQRAFTPRVLEESRDFIAALTDDLLTEAAASTDPEGVDIVQAIA